MRLLAVCAIAALLPVLLCFLSVGMLFLAEGKKTMLLPTLFTSLVLAGLFALAVVWISKQGGWKGEGCGGNCASCHQHCDTPEKKH